MSTSGERESSAWSWAGGSVAVDSASESKSPFKVSFMAAGRAGGVSSSWTHNLQVRSAEEERGGYV
jgi:hypothetical protein